MDMRQIRSLLKRSDPKNRKTVMILAGTSVVILLLSYHAISFIYSLQWEEGLETVEPQDLPEEAPTGAYTFELKDVAVHLMSQDGKRMAYAQFSLIIDCRSGSSLSSLKDKKSVILNHIFEVSNNFTLEQMMESNGKASFKKAVLLRLEESFGEVAPQDILIQRWILG